MKVVASLAATESVPSSRGIDGDAKDGRIDRCEIRIATT
jgi:hypothetical protein